MKLEALPNRLALASLVMPMPTCQAARSEAKKRPPMARLARRAPDGAGCPRCWRQANRARKGIASASRQNPEATGPTSASRTIHGPTARIRLPRISAGKAKREAEWAEARGMAGPVREPAWRVKPRFGLDAAAALPHLVGDEPAPLRRLRP